MYKFKHLPNLIKYLHHNIHKISAYPGYEILEYCESNKTQYINTGVSFNNTLIIDGAFQQLDYDGGLQVNGYGSNNRLPTFRWTNYAFTVNEWQDYSLGSADTEVHHIYISSGLQKRDGVEVSNVTYKSNSSSNNKNIYLYANLWEWYSTPGDFMRQRIYFLKMYKNGQLVRDFIPAKQISTGKVGLYDKLNKTFYGSANGNNFIAGPRVAYGI